MLAWILLLFCVFNGAQAEEFYAKIIVVIDGDTVLIRRASGLVKIRLAEIDAPEVGHAGMGGQPPNSQKAQAFGEASRQSLSDMVLGRQVNVVSQAVDKYGRMVAHLNVNGLDVNAEQIRRGMAWEYSNFHSNKELIALQEEAQNASRGLWTQNKPTAPWEWRKQHPSIWPEQSPAPVPPVASRRIVTSPDPTCGNKKLCSEMASCDEAIHYFTACGIKALDGNRNGVPCESLCGGRAGQ